VVFGYGLWGYVGCWGWGSRGEWSVFVDGIATIVAGEVRKEGYIDGGFQNSTYSINTQLYISQLSSIYLSRKE
jgi:hypothetical protein